MENHWRMTSTIIIKDLETAIDAYASSWIDNFDWGNVDFSEEANITIKLNGEQWDGRFDYKISEFVIRLQKAFLEVLNSSRDPKVRYNSKGMDELCPRVIVSVEKGCSWIKILFKEMWSGMESKDKRDAIIAGVLLLTIGAGVVSWHKIDTDKDIAAINANKAIELAKEDAKEKIELKLQERQMTKETIESALGVADRAFKTIDDMVAPMSYLSLKMQPKDVMEFNSTPISSDEAREIFKQNINVSVDNLGEENSYIIDGTYVVTSCNSEKDTISVKFDDKKRTFSLNSLNKNQRGLLFYRSSQKVKGALVPFNLQLRAWFRGGVFQRGTVDGVGPIREGAMSFTDAAMASAHLEEDKEKSSSD